MAICRNCGLQTQDGLPQCPRCGAPMMQTMNQMPNQQGYPNMNYPQPQPKKKHGCLIAALAVIGVFLIGSIGMANRNRDSGKVEVNSSGAGSRADNESESQDESSAKAEVSAAEESSAKKDKEFSYEISDTNFNYYTNSIGKTEYYGIVEILNTGNTNIYLDDCTFDLEDNDGHLLQSDNYISRCPKIIAPGEKGYFYNSIGSCYIDESVSMDNGIKLVPQYTVEEAKGDIVEYEVSDTEMRTDDYNNIKITGRVKNNSEKDDSLLYIQFLFYDKDEKILCISGVNVTDFAAGSTKSFEGTTMFSNNEVTIDMVSSYKVIARKNYHQ